MKKNNIPLFFGQFGNHIQQISNAIYYCIENGIDLSFNKPNVLDNQETFSSGLQIEGNKENDLQKNTFFFFSKGAGKGGTIDDLIIKDYDKFINTKKEICKKYIVPIVSFENDVETIPDNVLVVHFRGGDAWDSRPHPQYSPFPYSHIKKVAEKYDEIIIVHQDETNLIMKKFISDFSEKIIKTVSSSLRHDISYLMNATNLLQTSVGTFLPAIALMSKKIKNYYSSSNTLDNHIDYRFLRKSCNCYVTTTPKNISFRGNEYNEDEWKVSPHQVQILLEN